MDTVLETLTAGNITNTGACIATRASGKKAFILGALPGEEVVAEITRERSKFSEGVAVEIAQASEHRVAPLDDAYLHTSPWQIVEISYENALKAQLIVDAYRLNGIEVQANPTTFAGSEYHYRSKYTFYLSPDYELGVKARSSDEVVPTKQFSLARPELVTRAYELASFLQEHNISPASVHSLLVRSDGDGNTAAQINLLDTSRKVNSTRLTKNVLSKQNASANLKIAYLNPRNPQQVRSVTNAGSATLTDALNGKRFEYGIDSFFQVNKLAYEKALQAMSQFCEGDIVDLYSGVGSIGLSLASSSAKNITCVDVDRANFTFAKRNAQRYLAGDVGGSARDNHSTDLVAASTQNSLDLTEPASGRHIRIICASASKTLQEIVPGATLIVNPARNGLAGDVVERILAARPARIIYLSCNPTTQARDIAKLLPSYSIKHLQGFNFFPKTPHTECLCVLG